MNQNKVLDDAREKIAREIFGICCPGYEFHDEEMYLGFADQILALSGTTDIECPKCEGKKQYLAKWGTQASWERCPRCEGTGLISSKWKVSVTLENGELPEYHRGEEATCGESCHFWEQRNMLNAKYRQVVE